MAQTPVKFADGLSFDLPADWKATLFDGTSEVTFPVGADDLEPLAVLLHAIPEDAKRASTFTVVRDNAISRSNGKVAGMQDAIVRLRELAASQGFGAAKVTVQAQDRTDDTFFRVEVEGINSKGERRNFLAVFLLFPRATFRCYWQADAADTALLPEFETWLETVAFNSEKIAPLMAKAKFISQRTGGFAVAKPQVPEGESQPASENPAAAALASPAAAASVPSPAATPSAVVANLVSNHRDSLIVIEGRKGVGSGFLCNVEGKPMLFTNTHVLCDNPQPRYTRMTGGILAPAEASLAVGADIFRMVVPDSSASLETLPEIHSSVKIGDEVVVLGNAEGAGVVKPLEGKVVGIGPNLVEVDAPFVPGNSGSPIVHVPSGKVIGIATYLQIRKIDNDKGAFDTEIRRFGYRLDTVPSWEPLDWRRFDLQASQLAKIEETSEEFIKLFSNAEEKKRISYSDYENPSIRRALEKFSRLIKGSRLSESDLNAARRGLYSDLRAVALGDVNTFDRRTAYDYFRRAVDTEKKLRDEVCGSLTKAVEAARN